MSDFKWYIVQTKSGLENKFAKSVRECIKLKGLSEYFGEVMVPEEEIKKSMANGKTRIQKSRIFPSYVLIEMNPTPQAISAVRSAQGFSLYVGGQGTVPTPITKDEADDMLRRKEAGFKTKATVDFNQGDLIKVTEGAFAGFNGTVDKVVGDKVTVSVSVFGRPTPLELPVTQIQKQSA